MKNKEEFTASTFCCPSSHLDDLVEELVDALLDVGCLALLHEWQEAPHVGRQTVQHHGHALPVLRQTHQRQQRALHIFRQRPLCNRPDHVTSLASHHAQRSAARTVCLHGDGSTQPLQVFRCQKPVYSHWILRYLERFSSMLLSSSNGDTVYTPRMAL